MKDNMEYIEQYFAGLLEPAAVRAFEKKLAEEPSFAEEVAFYVAALQAAKDEAASPKKKRFKEIYTQQTTAKKPTPMRVLWPYAAAAAAIAGIIVCWMLFMKPVSVQHLAQQYIDKNFTTLGVTMSSREDELQKGLSLYNEGRFPQALEQFQKLLNLDSADFTAKKYAGITALRLTQYDKAVHYFELLRHQTGLYANPGAFLQATTLLKRNQPGDKLTARRLLEEVVQNDLEGKEIATQWLKKW
jgi:tetratricopeptide (TPR) repeat protein